MELLGFVGVLIAEVVLLLCGVLLVFQMEVSLTLMSQVSSQLLFVSGISCLRVSKGVNLNLGVRETGLLLLFHLIDQILSSKAAQPWRFSINMLVE